MTRPATDPTLIRFKHSETHTYDALVRSVRSEAEVNKTMLNESFLKYYEDGVVLREFSLLSATQCLANPLFVRHTNPQQIEALSAYLLNLNLAKRLSASGGRT